MSLGTEIRSLKYLNPRAVPLLGKQVFLVTIFVSAATISDSEIVAASGFQSLITNYEARLTEMGKLVEKKIALGEVSEPGDLIPEYARDPNIGRSGKK